MLTVKSQLAVAAIILLALMITATVSFTQPMSKSIDDYLTSLPKEVKKEWSGPQTYRMEYFFYNRDINGNTHGKIFTTGEYTRALEDSSIRWNNVRIASTGNPDDPMPEGNLVQSMEGFSYKVSEDIMKESFYSKFPNDLRNLMKTLVWDGVMIEMFDLMIVNFDSLHLNQFHRVSQFENFDVQMCDWGNIKMKDLGLKWAGVSKMNDEICALIHYRSFSNPVNATTAVGRSLYWGQVWISLEDREIECLTLNEDVVLNMVMGNAGKQLMDIQREVKFEKTR